MSDDISRQTLLNAYKASWYAEHMKELPTAEPEKRTEERAETHACDSISRQAAITQLSHNKNKGDDEWELAVESDIQTIWKLPSIQPETHWIPVTERLPEPRESVIISVNSKYGNWVGEGCYWETTENHVIWKGYRWNATYWDDEIIACMPLPEPYKGGETT